MRILRHELGVTDYQVLKMPSDGELLSVARSRTMPDLCIDLWSLDYEHGDPWLGALYVIGTGNPMPEDLAAELAPQLHDQTPGASVPLVPLDKFLGTVITPNGLVWHVFHGPVRELRT